MPSEEDELKVSSLLVSFLMSFSGKKQEGFGQAAGVDQADISRYLRAKRPPREKTLRRMAAAAGVPWPAVLHLRRFFEETLAAVKRRRVLRPSSDGPRLQEAILEAALLALSPFVLEEVDGRAEEVSAAEARKEAAEVWEALQGFEAPYQRRLLEASLRSVRNWALVEKICAASAKAAACETELALSRAKLALFVARQVEGKESLRLSSQGYAWGFIANARRVANDFAGADEAFAQRWHLWRAIDPSEPVPFEEWRLFNLEASLLRAQGRYSEALDLLDRALEACGGSPEAVGRILLKREHVLVQKGDHEGALAVLAEATPLLEELGDRRLLFGLRFNTVDNLWHLSRYAEAAERLPRVRELLDPANELDAIRCLWLEARVAGGLGRRAEAVASLEQVQREFTRRTLPYDAALSTLDLALLWLEDGRTDEVRELAVGMGWIFQAQGVHTRALAALNLFCEAARQDAATLELARQVIRDVERARRLAPEKSLAPAPGGAQPPKGATA